MKCPLCGLKTRVTNSRTIDSNNWGPNSSLIREASEAVGWYTFDWVARTRACGCGWKATTIEILAEDWAEMQEEIALKNPLANRARG